MKNKIYKKVFNKLIRLYLKKYLSLSTPPVLYGEKEFNLLLKTTQPRPDYGYDWHHKWTRGAQRASDMIKKCNILKQPGLQTLELGCGDGMVSYHLADFGHKPTLLDIEDWREPCTKPFPFIKSDLLNSTNLSDESQDCVFSFNSFEHFTDPKIAYNEALRVCKPGGIIFLEFGPLFYSPWGFHAYNTIPIPYLHLIFSESYVLQKLKEMGVFDLGKNRSDIQPLNRWKYSEFLFLFTSHGEKIKILKPHLVMQHLDIAFKYRKAFRGRNLCLEDIIIQAITICLEKPGLRN
jgi:SAM-dependent methyltransferase